MNTRQNTQKINSEKSIPTLQSNDGNILNATASRPTVLDTSSAILLNDQDDKLSSTMLQGKVPLQMSKSTVVTQRQNSILKKKSTQLADINSQSSVLKSQTQDPRFKKQKSLTFEQAKPDEIDYLNDLDLAQQFEANDLIKGTTITPFDNSNYCQTINNPFNTKDKYEIITVQRVQENVAQFDSVEYMNRIQQDQDPFLTCGEEGHKFKRYSRPKKDEIVQCEFCKDKKNQPEVYVCADCEKDQNKSQNFDICPTCQKQSFIRNKLEKKTKRHHYYEPKIIKSNTLQLKKDESIKDVNLQRFNTQNKRSLEETLQVTKTNTIYNAVKSNDLADLQPDPIHELPSSQNFCERAIIGFWQTNQTNQLICYRQFIVLHPLFFGNRNNTLQVQNFLHLGDENRLFFFNLSEENEVNYNEIDLKTAMDQRNPYPNITEEKFNDPEELKKYVHSTNLFHLPINKTICFQDIAQKFLTELFQVEQQYRMAENAQPQLYKNHLSFSCSLKVPEAEDKTIKFEIAKNQPSLIFLDLNDVQNIKKVIPSMHLHLKFQENLQQDLEIWCCDQQGIYIMKYDSLPDSVDQMKQQFNKKVKNSTKDYCSQFYDFTGQDSAHFKNLWTKQIDLQGRIHKEDSRCTLIFGQQDYQVFQLEKRLNQANLIFDHDPATDFSFCQTTQGLCGDYLIGNLKLNPTSQDIYGFDSYYIDLLHLDEEIQQSTTNTFNDKLETKAIVKPESLHMLLPNYFKKLDPQANKQCALHHFSSISLSKNFDEKKDNKIELISKFMNIHTKNKWDLRITMFHTHNDQSRQNIAFCKGRSNLDARQKSNLDDILYHFPNTPNTNQFQVKWPLIMHNTHIPQQNQIMISNFARNQPQIKLDLGNFRFICFVETGFSVPFPEKFHNQIYFLAYQPDTESVRLLMYQSFAWPIDPSNDKLEAKNKLSIISGEISLQNAISRKAFTIDKINKVCMIHHTKYDQSIEINILVQLSDRILVFNLGKQNENTILFCSKQEDEMLQLQMISAPNNQAYYIKRHEIGDKVMCIYLNGKQVEEKSIYQHKGKILQVQLANDQDFSEGNHSLYILTDDNQFIEINYKQGLETPFQEQKFPECRKVQLKGLENLLKNLEHQSFQHIALSQRSITCSKPPIIKEDEEDIQEKDKLNESDINKAITYNIQTQTKTFIQFLDFNADIKQKLINSKSITNERKNQKLNYNCRFLTVKLLDNIDKLLFVVQENQKTYFMAKKSFDNRQIELFDKYQSKKLVKNIEFAGNKIAVGIEGQTLLFNQYDFMLSQSAPLTDLKKFNNNYGSQKSEYFSAKMKEKNSKTEKTVVVEFPLNPFGLRIVRSECSTQYFKQIKKNLIESLGKVNFRLANMQMLPIMSNQGTYVQTYLIRNDMVSGNYGLGKKNSKDQNEEPELKRLGTVNFNNNESTFIYKIQKTVTLNPNQVLISSKSFKLDQRQKEKEQDCLYLVRCKQWDSLNPSNNILSLTEKYLVLRIDNEIYFIELDEIQQVNEEANQQFQDFHSLEKKNQPDLTPDLSENYEFDEQLNWKIENNKCKIKINKLNLPILLNDELKKNEFLLFAFSNESAKRIDTQKFRKNLIQIMFKDVSIVWDLDLNVEVQDFRNISVFSTPSTYVNLEVAINIQNPKNVKIKSEHIISKNNEQSLFIRPRLKDEAIQLFSTYTTLDLFEIKNMKQKYMDDCIPDTIDDETILCNIYGNTFFDNILDNGLSPFEFFCERLNQIYQPTFKEETQITEQIYIRRLYETLNLPCFQKSDNKQSILNSHFISRVDYQTSYTEQTFFNKIFKEIGRLSLQQKLEVLCKHLASKPIEVNLSDVFQNFEDYKKFLKTKNTQIQSFINSMFIQNDNTRSFTEAPQLDKKQIKYFTSNTRWMNKEQIGKALKSKVEKRKEQFNPLYKYLKNSTLFKKCFKQEKQNKRVTVKIIEIGWISDNMKNFYRFLSEEQIDLFQQELVKCLVKYQDCSRQIRYKVVPLQLIYYILSIIYHTCYAIVLEQPNEDSLDYTAISIQFTLAATILVFSILDLIREFKKLGELGRKYLKLYWNLSQFMVCVFNIVIIFWTTSSIFYQGIINRDIMTYLASFTVICIWYNVFYWARLVKRFLIFVELLKLVFDDIKGFLGLFFLILLLFANAFYIIDLQNVEARWKPELDWPEPDLHECLPSDGKVVKDIMWSKSQILNTVYYSYMVSIGENELQNYENTKYPELTYTLFMIASLVLQVVFLNLIIAILTDSYNKVMEKKDSYNQGVCTVIYADYFKSLKFDEDELKRNRYLYVVTYEDDLQEAEWEGSIQTIKKTLAKQEESIIAKISEVKNEIDKKFEKIQSENQDSKDSVQELKLDMKKFDENMQELQQGFGSFQKDVEALKTGNDELKQLVKHILMQQVKDKL